MSPELKASNERVRKIRDSVLWIVANALTQYAVACCQDTLSSDVLKFYKGWAMMAPNDKALVRVWHK